MVELRLAGHAERHRLVGGEDRHDRRRLIGGAADDERRAATSRRTSGGRRGPRRPGRRACPPTCSSSMWPSTPPALSIALVAASHETRYVGPSAASGPVNGATSATVSVELAAVAADPSERRPRPTAIAADAVELRRRAAGGARRIRADPCAAVCWCWVPTCISSPLAMRFSSRAGPHRSARAQLHDAPARRAWPCATALRSPPPAGSTASPERRRARPPPGWRSGRRPRS